MSERVEVSEPAAPRVTASVKRDPPRRSYLWTGAATVVVAAGTGFFAYQFSQRQSELDDILAAPAEHEFSEAETARDRARRSALYTNLGLGVTAVGAVATAVLFVLYDRGPAVTPTVSSTGRGDVALSWSATW